jgi:hypothetical protein
VQVAVIVLFPVLLDLVVGTVVEVFWPAHHLHTDMLDAGFEIEEEESGDE